MACLSHSAHDRLVVVHVVRLGLREPLFWPCLLYTSDAADE